MNIKIKSFLITLLIFIGLGLFILFGIFNYELFVKILIPIWGIAVFAAVYKMVNDKLKSKHYE